MEIEKEKQAVSGGHHLVMGSLVDFLTGRTMDDTHDERLRQKIVRFLVEERGYEKGDIVSRVPLVVSAGDKRARIYVDFLIRVNTRIVMLVKYGPGSIVTRQRPALALSRLVAPYQVPLVVVTNGYEAHLLDGNSSKQIGSGFESIPAKKDLLKKELFFPSVSPRRAEVESRLAFAYEVDGSCPCDDDVCML